MEVVFRAANRPSHLHIGNQVALSVGSLGFWGGMALKYDKRHSDSCHFFLASCSGVGLRLNSGVFKFMVNFYSKALFLRSDS